MISNQLIRHTFFLVQIEKAIAFGTQLLYLMDNPPPPPKKEGEEKPKPIVAHGMSRDVVEKLLGSLKYARHLPQAKAFYEQKQYDKVIEILVRILTASSDLNQDLETCQENYSMLIESFWAIDKFEDCFTWTVKAIGLFRRSSNQALLGALHKNLDCCYEMLERDLNRISADSRAQLATQLVDVLNDMVHKSNGIHNDLPWFMFYNILRHEEDLSEAEEEAKKEESKKEDEEVEVSAPESVSPAKTVLGGVSGASSSSSSKPVRGIPPSLRFLISAHDYLGQMSCCTYNTGALLKKLVDLIVEHLRRGNLSAKTTDSLR